MELVVHVWDLYLKRRYGSGSQVQRHVDGTQLRGEASF